MRVLSIGTDRKLFEEGSAALARQKLYADKLGQLDIIVFTKDGPLKITEVGSLHIIPTNSRLKLLYGFDAWRIARKLPRPDVVTVQDPFETGLIGFFIAHSLRVPLHVQVHTDFTSRAFARSSFQNWIRQKMAWFVLKRAVQIRVILERTADEIRAHGVTAPVTVLPIFVDVERLSKIPRTKHPRWKIALLCIGRLEKEKRFEIAIDALAAARAKGHDAGLTIVGEGSERSVLESRARELGLSNRVEFVGWQNDLTKYYSEADIVLVPSRFEGYGLVIVEALAAGIPVLSTDVGVAREAGAIVVSKKEFSQSLLRWIQDGPRKATISDYPYASLEAYVSHYSLNIADSMKRVI